MQAHSILILQTHYSTIQKGSINKCAHIHKESTPSTIFANPLLYNSEGSIYTHNSISTNSLHYNSKGLSKKHTDTKTNQTRNKYKFKLKKNKKIISLESLTFGLRP